MTREIVSQWQVVEFQFSSKITYIHPVHDIRLSASFTSPEGDTRLVDAFWDGGNIWRVRFSPDCLGEWTWEMICSDSSNRDLHGQSGLFTCVAYEGENPLYTHGALKLSDNRRYLTQDEGTPFFWLADTAWNGVLRADPDDWHRYLQMRQNQHFTVIQFVATQWRGSTTDPTGNTAFSTTDPIQINPTFFQRLDNKVQAINHYGMLACPVMLWANLPEDPGLLLSKEGCIVLARYQQARWGAYQVAWILGGDSRYEKGQSQRWKEVGRAVFDQPYRRLVTMHPVGANWSPAEFRGESWFDIIGYQSGHSESDEHRQWLTTGPPSSDWQTEPPHPIINLEPNYEYHPSYETGHFFTDHDIRRTAYWSLLVSPTAGITFGHNSIWVWREDEGEAEGHRLDNVMPWYYGLETPGTESMTALKYIFMKFEWWTLLPAPELLAVQPGSKDVRWFIAVASNANRSEIIIYSPLGGTIAFKPEGLDNVRKSRWINPRTGIANGFVEIVQPEFQTPDQQDWVLQLCS